MVNESSTFLERGFSTDMAMRSFAIIATAGAISLTALASAEGRPVWPNERWCLNANMGGGGDVIRCLYATYNDCMASRSANGEWCMLNPALGSERPRYYYR
jgi:hypothetical protein